MPTFETSWHWERFDPTRTSLSGDVSKLFRNEPIEAPGILSVNKLPSDASMLAREVIQNSWDSGLEAQQDSTQRSTADRAPDIEQLTYPGFDLVFEFQSVSGSRKKDLVSALALDELADRVTDCEEQAATINDRNNIRKVLGLPDQSCLDQLDDHTTPLKFLVITETGTTGMYGPWGKDSRMYLALASLGYTPKKEGGGSFGYGKAGMIRGSATRT